MHGDRGIRWKVEWPGKEEERGREGAIRRINSWVVFGDAGVGSVVLRIDRKQWNYTSSGGERETAVCIVPSLLPAEASPIGQFVNAPRPAWEENGMERNGPNADELAGDTEEGDLEQASWDCNASEEREGDGGRRSALEEER